MGDPLYSNIKNGFKLNAQMLHARKVGFTHPRSKEYMEFESNPPANFIEITNSLR